MSLADTIYQKSLDLPIDKATEVIDFIDFIKMRTDSKTTIQTDAQNIKPSNLYQAFEQAGLIGCLKTDEQLSTTYKQKLNFSHKHGKNT
ncbi:DUF2281 domain-containing protein [Candidatus Venteria ishoeyi]|uniref:DUF2281 domain-containing protein n=1 Tax=Candidatus Venteria ishoeyi TaxID=1899563 RepID=A0A1H6F6A0_9GAMM|nr:DUF2281 domain-containing protein [Candidatus Venteria ishoeyi]SEH05053.1 Uncharacterised protein [Candidatus Venteria ishoeyi]